MRLSPSVASAWGTSCQSIIIAVGMISTASIATSNDGWRLFAKAPLPRLRALARYNLFSIKSDVHKYIDCRCGYSFLSWLIRDSNCSPTQVLQTQCLHGVGQWTRLTPSPTFNLIAGLQSTKKNGRARMGQTAVPTNTQPPPVAARQPCGNVLAHSERPHRPIQVS